MSGVHFVIVGHCGADTGALTRLIRRAAPGATVSSVNSVEALASPSNAGAVLLVNRALDGWFEDESGIDLIRRLSAAADPPTMLLISNYADAQAAAIAAGARPGFGKSQLGDPRVAEMLAALAADRKDD